MKSCVVAIALITGTSLLAGPFDGDSTVQIAPTQGVTFEQRLEDTERQITRGIQRAGQALDKLAADLDRLARDLNSSTRGTGTSINTGGCTGSSCPTRTQSPQAPTDSTSGAQVGDAFKDFIQKVGDMFKAIGEWAKCLWKELTGPSKEEAPITSTINSIKTDWAGHRVQTTAKKAGQSAIGLFTSIGNFFKSLFS